MIDHVVVKIKGGDGGNGKVSGHRERFVPAGGPDGGDGGDGGSVVFRSDNGVSTFLGFRHNQRFAAGSGGNGGSRMSHGKNGSDREVVVPVGTELWAGNGEEWCMADMSVHGEHVVVARGGRGGKGNTRFTSSTNQFPLLAEAGERGEELRLRLELKLLADVGIIGAPNAGKSSLLAAVTAARPRIAGYPFTTLEPVLGVVERGGRSLVMVDIPGLIEGAHGGTGLGDKFLKHVQRTRMLIHVVDGGLDDPAAEYRKVRNELALFSQELAEKPEVVAVNKLDITGVHARFKQVQAELEGLGSPVHCISAAGRQGLDDLMNTVLHVLSEVSDSPVATGVQEEEKVIPVLRPGRVDKEQVVRKDDGAYVVSLMAATRLAAMVNGSDWSARVQLYERLRRMGVIDALQEAGIQEGDTFKVGNLEWEWD
jgi:GTP-binding protein